MFTLYYWITIERSLANNKHVLVGGYCYEVLLLRYSIYLTNISINVSTIVILSANLCLN